MKILITNDDGIQSPGIQSLRKVLSSKHDVWLMAPDGDRSGFSQSITLRDPVKIVKLDNQIYSCSGTPVDCVVYGYSNFLDKDFDLILSGINIGPNLGTDILYSGTAAAARQGALKGVPSIALSLNQFKGPFHFDLISEYLMDRLENLVSLWDDSCFLNMNFPETMDMNTEMKWCWPAVRTYRDEIVQFQAPREPDTAYCMLKGNLIASDESDGSDVLAVHSGHVSISAIRLAPAVVPHIGTIPEKEGICCG
ncbi:MAG: 5'/3'-nucleotidase SurE [Spirochaetales bacterium]|nr:5'/3'-nucleotidase SurE [Spirochaetales bacterium]